MTKLQLLNVYLTERLTAAVREILDVVGDTVTEYREETARTKRENESLRRQLRDIVLLEAETDWLRPSRSIPLSPSGQQHCEQEWHSSHVKGPDLGPTHQNQVNRSGPPQTQNQGVACQNGSLTDQNLGRREMEESQFNLSQMEVKVGPLESLTKTEPDVVPEAFGNAPSLVSPSSLNTHSVPASSASLEAAAFRVENQNPSPHQTQEPIKMEPEECDITASNPESHSDSGFPDCPVPLVLAHNPSEEAGLREASDMAVAEVPRGPDPQTHEADHRPEEGIPFEGGNDFDASFQEERPHRCPRCGESFSQACSLRLHLQYRKPYACDWCCKSFAQSADLRRHLRTHTGERPHRCTWCSKSFTQRGNLRRHLRIHTGERPYSCPYCYRTFSDGDTMKKHKRTHSGEKPYRCSQCPKSFTVASGLQVHLKKHLRDGQLLT